MTMKTIDLPFSPADVRANAEKQMRDNLADRIWPSIMADPELKSARSKLSVHEFRTIIAHCLSAMGR
jgi:hypothetical protein